MLMERHLFGLTSDFQHTFLGQNAKAVIIKKKKKKACLWANPYSSRFGGGERGINYYY